MTTDDGVLYCRLIGGPLDGASATEWKGCHTIMLNSDQDSPDETRGGVFHVYKRCDPDVFTTDGLTEFHFHATTERQME